MSIQDFSKNCSITESSFLSDLFNYTVDGNTITWLDNKNTKTNYTIKNNINLFQNNTPTTSIPNSLPIWEPNFVNDDNLIDNKTISHYGSIVCDSDYASGRIGIEDFILFEPNFKNWTVDGDAKMSIDWILNRSKIPYSISAGINYWKRNDIAVTGYIDKFPTYSRLKFNNNLYIKLDDQILRNIGGPSNGEQNTFKINGDIEFGSYNTDISVSSLIKNNTQPIFTLHGSDNTKIWIPDGDQLLYFLNKSERTKNFLNNIGPRSYITGSLYKYYNIFYNALTANENLVRINTVRPIRKLRLYKKLAHAMSTSPFASEFFVSFLSKPSDGIKNSIEEYLNSVSIDLKEDIKNLKKVLSDISKEFSAYEIGNNSNIVSNNSQLFKKLINKYGAKLKISNSTKSIQYKNPLKYGDSVIIEEIGDTFIPKTLSNTVVTNNKTISLSKLSIETQLSENISNILLKSNSNLVNTVYLYNVLKPKIIPLKSSINIAIEKNTDARDNGVGGPITKIPLLEDYVISNNIFYWTETGPGPTLRAINLELEEKYVNPTFPMINKDFIEKEFSCLWEKVSGPELKFIDLNKQQTGKTYSRAYGNETQLIPSTTGKYVIKCTVSGPYGIFTKIRTIFIVNGIERIKIEDNKTEDNPNFGKYLQSKQYTTISETEQAECISEIEPIQINSDNNNINIAGQNSVAIHRNGLFVPISTNDYIERTTSKGPTIQKLADNNYSFMFYEDDSKAINPAITNSTLKISYSCDKTIIKLDRIILKNIRNETEECSQCYSLYKPKVVSFIGGVSKDKPFYIRANKNLDGGFGVQTYNYNNTINKFEKNIIKEYFYPKISTDIAPKIKGCGGYGNQVLDTIDKYSFINTRSLDMVPDRIQENSGIVAGRPQILPSITGYSITHTDDYGAPDRSSSVRNYKLCYQDHVMPSSGGIVFNKGTFIPDSGWVVGASDNMSSVLKFNPGARKTYSFSGPGILGLHNYTNNSGISASVYKSCISLNIDPSIVWDLGTEEFCPEDTTVPGADERNRNKKADINASYYIGNPVAKEFADQYFGSSNQYNHGYRTLSGGRFKRPELNSKSSSMLQNDEFNIAISEEENLFNYSFSVIGPHNPINISDEDRKILNSYKKGIKPTADGDGKDFRDSIESISEPFGLRNPRINNLKIKDIEIQLNFLNYVNTKNLMIWLEIEYSSYNKDKIQPIKGRTPTIPPQTNAPNIFIDQFIRSDTYKASSLGNNNYNISDNINVKNSGIKSFLKELVDMNSADEAGDNLILYLLNQETIQNKEYTFSVKFSDTADKHNTLYDHNMFSSGIIIDNQRIISNKDSVCPTKNIYDHNTCKNAEINNLIKFHSLNINNNTFNKFRDIELFKTKNKEPSKDDCIRLHDIIDSSTKFILNIAILEEEDEMIPIDTVINTEIYTNIASVDKELYCTNIFNNLCSWELILHTDDVKKPTVKQVTSLDTYGATDALGLIEYGEKPKYPGYSFIANLEDSKFLLPLVNMNAPHTFFQNYNACEYADEEIVGKGISINTPRFPTEAILMIISGTAVGGMTGTIAGTLIGGLGPSYARGFDLLFQYFAESRRVPILESVQRDIYDMSYDSYPFGSSDKILLNISKDGVFWYKVEASIFKLSNTPALPNKKYSLIKDFSRLFRFKFDIVESNKDIIDDIFIPYIIEKAIPANSNDEEKKLYSNIDGAQYKSFDFLTVDKFVNFNKLINNDTNIFETKNNGKTLAIIDHTMPYYLINIGDNVSIPTGLNLPTGVPYPTGIDGISAKILSKGLVYKEGSYKTILGLDIDNKLSIKNSGYDQLYLPDDVVVLCGYQQSTIDSDKQYPISNFGLVSDQPNYESIPDLTFSTNSLGSYGDGSSVKDKNILSRKIQVNTVDSIYNILNNFNHDKYYFNKINLILPSGDDYINMSPGSIPKDISIPTGIPISINSRFASYPAHYQMDTNSIINTNFYHIYDKDFTKIDTDLGYNEIISIINGTAPGISGIKDNKNYLKNTNNNIIYLKIDNNIIRSLYRNTNALVTIENNYTHKESIQKISIDDINILTDRLSKLELSYNDDLENIVGLKDKTQSIINSGSLHYLQKHYDLLPTDTYDCSGDGCYKSSTYSSLNKLYNEKNNILNLLNNQTYADAIIYESIEDLKSGNTVPKPSGRILSDDRNKIRLLIQDSGRVFDKNSIYKIQNVYYPDPEKRIYGFDNNDIIPEYKANIIKRADGSIDITYDSVSNNYYWINIDPKQSCSIAEEMRPKVLKSIEYICQNINPAFNIEGLEIKVPNNICPDPSKVNGKTGADIDSIEADSSSIKYKIKNQTIIDKKNAIEKSSKNKIFGWKEQSITRKFRMNNEGIPNFDMFTNVEIIVTAIEIYDVAINELEFNGVDKSSLSMSEVDRLIGSNLIKNDYSNDVYDGLFDFTNNKKQLTRVYNIFNLDDTPSIQVQFRKVPRAIRGIDAIGTILRYGELTTYVPQSRPPLDPLDVWGIGRTESLINNFYKWKCVQHNPLNNSIENTSTPDFFKNLNEMLFRAFFGSADNIENKTTILKSMYDFEMIPYEYFIKKQ